MRKSRALHGVISRLLFIRDRCMARDRMALRHSLFVTLLKKHDKCLKGVYNG